MIALNELLKNLDEYEKAYKLMGLKVNLNVFVELEEKLKQTQLDFEHKRALCNKMCGELIIKNTAGNNTTEDIKKIEKLDAEASKLQKKLAKITNKINSKLAKLDNKPDNLNTKHLQIDTNKKESSISDLKKFFDSNYKTEQYKKSNKSFIKTQVEKVFDQKTLPFITNTKDGAVILCSLQDIDEVLEILLNFFKQNSLSIIEKAITNIDKSSAREFLIHLQNSVYIKMEVKREYFSRQFKIKYKDTSTDMTKFVNQININFK